MVAQDQVVVNRVEANLDPATATAESPEIAERNRARSVPFPVTWRGEFRQEWAGPGVQRSRRCCRVEVGLGGILPLNHGLHDAVADITENDQSLSTGR